ncbi:MAG: hypothetical protein EA420_00345 [Candidatus Competibacteraceae bacterium]|nr:MAG: hypothetical protein EA420_00345 [Candidatus Competibacteraceae bacterium]
MDWPVTAAPYDPQHFSDLVVDEVLYDVDGPRIFTVDHALGKLLFFLVDQQESIERYIVVPTHRRTIARLKQGACALREALDQPWVWILDRRFDGSPVACWRGTLDDLPPEVLPGPGVMLWPDLEPLVVLRAIGEGLAEGQVPASVMRQLIDGATTALKKVAGQVFAVGRGPGRKTREMRQFYDLAIQGFGYHSFEVAFRLADSHQADLPGLSRSTDLDAIGARLEQAMAWALGAAVDAPGESMDIELLEALEKLVPPLTGTVTAIEVRGRLFGDAGQRYTLTRENSRQVRAVLRQRRSVQERIHTVAGLIPELDKDNFSFTLRQTDDQRDHLCFFAPELLDEVLEAFNFDKWVIVSGRENLANGNIDVSIVAPYNAETHQAGIQYAPETPDQG